MASPNKDLKKELATPDSSSGLKRSYSDSENKDPHNNNNNNTENNTVKKRRRIVKIVCRKSATGSGVIDLCETDSTSGSGVIDLCATDSSDSSQTSCLTRKDTDSPFLLNILQKNTSEWTNIVLPIKFNLKFLNHVTVDGVFTKSIFHFIETEHCSEVLKFYLKGREIDKEKYECFQHAFLRVFDIDSCHISHISDDKILELNQIFEECQWIDTYIAESVHKQLLKRICDRELCKSLKSFVWQLLYMHRKCKRSTQKELTEGMYLELFVSFARIFGLNIVSGSNVDKYSLSIDNKDFFVIPDAVICHSSSNDDDKIFAVIKVKSCSQDEDKEEDRYLGSTCNHAKHIGSSLKGQHCGQFLCTLPNSAFGSRGMYGFIVQGTNVTLTSFIPDDGYFEHLCSGNLCEKGAVMTYSKQYNILRKEDRKQLVETFLDFEKLMKFVCMKK